jgi:hypothetical protein
VAYRDEVILDAPNGYWRLDGLTNESGGAGSLTAFGTPASTTGLLTGDASVARDLNGTTMYYTAPDSASTDLGDVFTLEAWIRIDALPASSGILLAKGTNSYQFDVGPTGALGLAKNGVAYTVNSTTTMSVGSTYHVVATKNGAANKLYINGVDVSGAVTNLTLVNTAVALHIGRYDGGGFFFDGVIDEVAIYPTALSATRVAAHYAVGSTGLAGLSLTSPVTITVAGTVTEQQLPEGPTVRVAFATTPGQPSLWTTVSAYQTGFSTRRGRQKELDLIDAGIAAVRFKNSDRRFDPTHTSSPYYPNVLPMRKLRVQYTRNTVTYPLFVGFVEAWPQTWQGSFVGWSEVSCADAFLPLSKADVGENETWPREFSGARINRILNAAGWPADDRAIDTGFSEIAEVTFALGAGVTALNAIREVAGGELGIFFVNGAGVATFHDRHHRKDASYLTSQATFSDGYSAGIPYQTVVLDTDADRIWNDIQVTATGGETQRAEDSASQTTYMRRTMARQVPLARDTESADQAEYLLAQYKDPKNRLAGITFTPATDAAWAQALGRELGDHITVKRHPQGVGSVITQECSIEAIQHAWTPAGGNYGLTTTWLLSTPAHTVNDWFTLDVDALDDAAHGLVY